MKGKDNQELFANVGTGVQRLGRVNLVTQLAKQVSVALLGFMTLVSLTHSTKGQIAAGNDVSVENQRALGLVTVNGDCSGTLLNQFWVLTARHCVTVDGMASSAFHPPGNIQITAPWAAKTGIASSIHDFNINSAVGSARDRDIVLVYLGSTNLGDRGGSQRIFVVTRDGKISGRLKETDTITQYGRGFSTFASDLMTPSAGKGTYRSAILNPSEISATHYELKMNGTQSGHGGDSGGPSVVTVYGKPNGGIAGVQSTCKAAGYVAGAPIANWDWATGILYCTYVSTEPFISEISAAIKETPLKPPFISAGHVILPTPNHPFGLVPLMWDGGPDYPSVEVWLSIDNGVEIPAFSIDLPPQAPVWKQPKMSIAPQLQRHHYYKFVLKSAGKTLSIAAFVVP